MISTVDKLQRGDAVSQIYWRSKAPEMIRAGDLTAKWSANGYRILRYYISFWHDGLSLHRELSAPETSLLQQKVDSLMAQWDIKYEQFQANETRKSGKGAADAATQEAGAKLRALSTILAHTLSVDDRVDWDSLKDHSAFAEPRFPESRPVTQPIDEPVYVEPRVTFLQWLIGSRRKILKKAERDFKKAMANWARLERDRKAAFASSFTEWEARARAFQSEVAKQRAAFLAEQAAHNANIDALAAAVREGEPQSIIEQAMLVLDASDYDGLFEKDYEVDYKAEQRTLFVDYGLPSPDNMPTVKAVKYVPSSGEMVSSYISDKDAKANYDLACYQIAIRTIHELLEADEYRHIESVSFNGYATYVDRSTGRDARACIMSVLARRDEFEAFDLSRVDPKACFKSLKGVSASTLAALAPVAPVVEMDREDRRFVEGRDVASGMSEGTNLAAMDWEEFEHLVRQLFEREFETRGGEVKITQASRDGGVDAVAFDPDPITGGKIVIQAKRYTRVVGVAAVRDLYGTLMNEGASRGILVTTADYGPDAYSFANGKPITLISGSNLLHMLGRHGFKAMIDVAAARKLLGAAQNGPY